MAQIKWGAERAKIAPRSDPKSSPSHPPRDSRYSAWSHTRVWQCRHLPLQGGTWRKETRSGSTERNSQARERAEHYETEGTLQRTLLKYRGAESPLPPGLLAKRGKALSKKKN